MSIDRPLTWMRAATVLLLVNALMPFGASAQNRSVRGTVVHAKTGAGLPGVLVGVAGGEYATQSREDGSFSLAVPGGRLVLRFEALGFATAEQVVEAERSPDLRLVVALEEEAVPVAGLVVNARRTETALKTNTPVLEIPQATSFVPGQVLRDQDALTMADALRNVSGVARSATDQGLYDYFHIRGFYASEFGNYRRNGVETYRFTDLNGANVERIEVIKGPSSVLYGNLEPGGIINVVTKQPEARVSREASVGGGSYEQLRGSIDLTGPLFSPDLLYRLNVGLRRGESGRDFVEGNDVVVSPVLVWRPDADTQLRIEAEIQDRSQVADPGLLTPGTSFDDADALRFGTFLGEPEARLEWGSWLVESTLERRLDPRWKMTGNASWAEYDRRPTTVSLLGLEDDGFTVRRHVDRQSYDFRYLHLEGLVTGHFSTGPVEHELVVGTSFRDAAGRRDRVRAPLASISLNAPRPSGLPGAVDFEPNLSRDQTDRLTGVFIQNRFRVGDRLHLIAGIRRTGLWRETVNLLATDPEPVEDEAAEWSPRLGLLFRVQPEVSVFANFSESFVPTFNVALDGTPFDPIYGRQIEAGARAEWFRGRLSSTVSLYRLTKTNEVSWVFDDTNGWYTVQGGRQRSEGLEVEVLGNVTPELGVQASYSWMNGRVLDDPNYEAGRPLSGAPDHSGSVWLTFEPTDRLRFGGGVFAFGSMPSWLSSDVRKPGFATVDGFLELKVRAGTTVQLNARNVTDKRFYTGAYATSTSSHLTTNLGAPRSFEVTLRSAF